MVHRTAALILLALFLISSPLFGQESEEIRQYEERLREMVNRFEEARELLRREIAENQALRRENSELRQRLESVREERNQLESMSGDERIAELQANLRESRDLNDALIRKLKHTVAEGRRLEARLKKAEQQRGLVQDDFLDLLEHREEQKLVQVGTGFSPSGYMNGLFMVNIPDSPIGLFAETNYRFREKDWSYSVGVQFRFLNWTDLLGVFADPR